MVARSAAIASATFGIVVGLYHRWGLGVVTGSPSNSCTLMTWRPLPGAALSIVSMNES